MLAAATGNVNLFFIRASDAFIMESRSFKSCTSGTYDFRFLLLTSDPVPNVYLNTLPTSGCYGNMIFKVPMSPFQATATWAIKS